jgi:hypothetical protein
MAKMPTERKRPRIGDVVEVRVPGKGFAYLQYVNFHRDPPGYGYLVRVLPGIFKRRPDSVAELAAAAELWFAFTTLGSACHRGEARIVGNESIPEHARSWPIFKAYNDCFGTGEKTWFIWDGVRSWRVGKLPKKYYDGSMEQVVTLDIVTDRIATGWMPRDEVPPGLPRGLR